LIGMASSTAVLIVHNDCTASANVRAGCSGTRRQIANMRRSSSRRCGSLSRFIAAPTASARRWAKICTPCNARSIAASVCRCATVRSSARPRSATARRIAANPWRSTVS